MDHHGELSMFPLEYIESLIITLQSFVVSTTMILRVFKDYFQKEGATSHEIVDNLSRHRRMNVLYVPIALNDDFCSLANAFYTVRCI